MGELIICRFAKLQMESTQQNEIWMLKLMWTQVQFSVGKIWIETQLKEELNLL